MPEAILGEAEPQQAVLGEAEPEDASSVVSATLARQQQLQDIGRTAYGGERSEGNKEALTQFAPRLVGDTLADTLGKEIGFALWTQTPFVPEMSPENKAMLDRVSGALPPELAMLAKFEPVGESVLKAATMVPGMFALGGGGLASKAIGAGFVAQGISQAGKEAGQVWADPNATVGEKSAAIFDEALNAGLATIGGAHLLTPAPETVAALRLADAIRSAPLEMHDVEGAAHVWAFPTTEGTSFEAPKEARLGEAEAEPTPVQTPAEAPPTEPIPQPATTSEGAPNAETIRSDTGQPAESGIPVEGSESPRGRNLQLETPQQPAEARPEAETAIADESTAKAPEPEGDGGLTSIKMAQVDSEREARGLQPIAPAMRKSWETALDDATQRMDSNPDALPDLLSDLRAKPRALTDTEDAMLTIHRQSLKNRLAGLDASLNDAVDSGDVSRIGELKQQRATIEDALDENDKMTRAVGTENARGLAFRKSFIDDDYSLQGMLQSVRAAGGGEPLSEETRAKVESLQKDIQAWKEKYAKDIGERDARIAKQQADAEMSKIAAEVKTGAEAVGKPKRASGVTDRLVARLEAKAQEARTRLSGKLLSPQPQDILDLATIVASRIARGGLTLAEMGADLVREFGEAVRPHLQDIWDKATALASSESKAMSVEDLTSRLKSKVETQRFDEVNPILHKLAKVFASEGVTELEPMVDKLHEVVQSVAPEMTREETMNAFSGYGKWRPLSKDAASVIVRDLKGQAQKVGKLLDMWQGEPPKKSGMEHPTPSDTQRRLIKVVNEAKKAFGIEVTSPENQLASALSSIKTRLRNSIADLEDQLRRGEKTTRDKAASPSDDETDALRARRDELKKQYDEMFPRGKKPLTDEQRIAAAKRSTESAISEYERRIKAGETETPEKGPRPSSPELDALRARRDALKAELDHLRDTNTALQEKKAAKALQQSIDENTRKIRENDLSTQKRPGISTPALDALRKQNADLLQKLADLREASGMYDEGRLQRAKDFAIKAIEENLRRINEADLEARKAKEGPTDSELDALRAMRDQSTKMLQEARRAAAPKKTPEEIALKAKKAAMLRRIAELEEKSSKGDFSTRKANPVALDKEGSEIQTRLRESQKRFEDLKEKERQKNLSIPERIAQTWGKFRRAFLLSGPSIIAKLGMSSAVELVSQPTKEAIGTVFSKTPGLNRISEMAPTEGGANLRAEISAHTDGVMAAIKAMGAHAKNKPSDLDTLMGYKDAPRELLDWFGSLHALLKDPARETAFRRAYEKSQTFEALHGNDITDPVIMLRSQVRAIQAAKRATFTEDNAVVDVYNRMMSYFSQKDAGGHVPTGRALAGAAIRHEFPIVRVPSNIVASAWEYSFGLAHGGVRAAAAFAKGIENLKPEEADLIMRQLKKGTLGGAIMLLGFLNPNAVGGYYQQGKKQQPGDVQYGGMRISGVDIPRIFLHNPLIEPAQIGATLRRVMDSKLRKSDAENQGVSAGAMAAAVGLVQEIPFVRETTDFDKALNPYERGGWIGNQVKSTVVPQAVSQAAEYFDKDAAGNPVKRKPGTVGEAIKSGIPGLRETVPIKR